MTKKTNAEKVEYVACVHEEMRDYYHPFNTQKEADDMVKVKRKAGKPAYSFKRKK